MNWMEWHPRGSVILAGTPSRSGSTVADRLRSCRFRRWQLLHVGDFEQLKGGRKAKFLFCVRKDDLSVEQSPSNPTMAPVCKYLQGERERKREGWREEKLSSELGFLAVILVLSHAEGLHQVAYCLITEHLDNLPPFSSSHLLLVAASLLRRSLLLHPLALLCHDPTEQEGSSSSPAALTEYSG